LNATFPPPLIVTQATGCCLSKQRYRSPRRNVNTHAPPRAAEYTVLTLNTAGANVFVQVAFVDIESRYESHVSRSKRQIAWPLVFPVLSAFSALTQAISHSTRHFLGSSAMHPQSVVPVPCLLKTGRLPKCFSRTAHPNSFTLNTALPGVPTTDF